MPGENYVTAVHRDENVLESLVSEKVHDGEFRPIDCLRFSSVVVM